MQWFKLSSQTWCDPKLSFLTLEERAVFYDLLVYASDQPERGTIRDHDERALARAVAGDRVELLRSTLAKLQEFRITETKRVALQHPCSAANVASAATRCNALQHETSPPKNMDDVQLLTVSYLNFGKRQGAAVTNSSTERSRKSRAKKELQESLEQGQHSSKVRDNTQRNAALQRAAKRCSNKEEIRLEEKREETTPPTPQGGLGRGQSASLETQTATTELATTTKQPKIESPPGLASSPQANTEPMRADIPKLPEIDDPDREPFDSGPPPETKTKPAPPLHPYTSTEVEHAAAVAEKLFPCLDFGSQVRAHAGIYPVLWIERALEDARSAGKSSWSYVMGILRRIDAEGGLKDLAKPAFKKQPDPPYFQPAPLPPPGWEPPSAKNKPRYKNWKEEKEAERVSLLLFRRKMSLQRQGLSEESFSTTPQCTMSSAS